MPRTDLPRTDLPRTDLPAGQLMTIGELARLAGLTVKTVRFWSDEGLVLPALRSPAGYRLYGPEAPARVDLVRTLRELGVGLAAIRRLLGREISIRQLAATHAAALDVQIRALRLHQAVLRVLASRETATPQEVKIMHKLAQLSAAERRRLVTDFIDETFSGLDLDPEFATMMRGAMPELPAEPAEDQIAAWVELAELVQDPDFRTSLRQSAAAQIRASAETAVEPSAEDHQKMARFLRERVAAAEGIAPAAPEARPVIDELVAAYARHSGRTDSPEFRVWLLELLESGSDRRYERYWQLLAIINGWPAQPDLIPAAEWLIAALRAG